MWTLDVIYNLHLRPTFDLSTSTMEKGNLATVPPTTRRSIKSLAVAFLLAGGLFYLANPINTARNGSLDTPNPFNCSPPVKNNDEFNWEEVSNVCAVYRFSNMVQLRPTKKLKWVPCHSGHECARLEVWSKVAF